MNKITRLLFIGLSFTTLSVYASSSIDSNNTASPKIVMQKYLNVLKNYNHETNLDIYTDTTKEFLDNWKVKTINQDHEIDSLTRCQEGEVIYSDNHKHAVIAHLPYEEHRTCAPYFFKKEKGSWKLDIATMAQTIKFNKEMQWHFNLEERLNKEGKYYAFAFDKLTFDKNGYPYAPVDVEKIPEGARWGFNSGAAWYEPGPSREEVRKYPERYLKAMIRIVYTGSYAEIRLGLHPGDYIRDMEVNGKFYKNVLNADFLRLMSEAKKGTVVKLFVKDRKGKPAIREGIAP